MDKFYEQVRATPEVRAHFRTDQHISQAKNAQLGHWGAISAGNFDASYAAKVHAIGLTHARIGLEPRWYVGGYALIVEHLIKSIVSEVWPKGMLQRASKDAGEEAGAALASLIKAVLLDMDIAISVYIQAAEKAKVEAEKARTREQESVTSSIAASLEKLAAKDLTFRMNADLPEAYLRL